MHRSHLISSLRKLHARGVEEELRLLRVTRRRINPCRQSLETEQA
jgi:hypothetical protein